MNRNNIPIMSWALLSLLMFQAPQCVRGADVYVNPEFGSFRPKGTKEEPWVLIPSAAGAAQGGTVTIKGGTSAYGPMTIDKPCRITTDGAAVAIGQQPLRQTTFRALSYNLRLNTRKVPFQAPIGWADAQRISALSRAYPSWGSPDFMGFCEVWGNDKLRNLLLASIGSDMRYRYVGPAGKDFPPTQSSGLAAKSRHELTGFQRHIYASHTGEDKASDKGWISGRIQKDGFGIWVIMTHMQADSLIGASWKSIYTARREQLTQLREFVKKNIMENSRYGNDVVLIMGDLNVYGEDRSPGGRDFRSEYSNTLRWKLGLDIWHVGMDTAVQFYPPRVEHTLTNRNSLANYFNGKRIPDNECARLDYIIAINSKDQKVRIRPVDYEVIKGMATRRIQNAGHTDQNLSDHYGIAADFRIMRVAQ